MLNITSELLVIDLEATSSRNKHGFQENNYIIDVGAVLLNSNLEVISTFESLVKPEEEITDFIKDLTGISNSMVQNQELFPKVAENLQSWLTSNLSKNSLKKVRLCAWGNYFDIPLLRKMYEKYALDYPFSGSAFDIKTMAFMWYALRGKKTDRLNVASVAKDMGITPEGDYHRAITDGIVEAKILKRVLKDLQGFFVDGKDGPVHFSVQDD